MTAVEINWDLVRNAAQGQGVSRFAVSKWKQRKTIPHKWRAHLVRATGGRITWKQFDEMDRARKAS